MNIPPINHTCCGTPCVYEDDAKQEYPCWGNITCIDYTLVDDDEYRYGACQGHYDMYPTDDLTRYNHYKANA